jgi:hypothetical protein
MKIDEGYNHEDMVIWTGGHWGSVGRISQIAQVLSAYFVSYAITCIVSYAKIAQVLSAYLVSYAITCSVRWATC